MPIFLQNQVIVEERRHRNNEKCQLSVSNIRELKKEFFQVMQSFLARNEISVPWVAY